jgi:acetyltransferase-like isoleucine patch superfamily enzyme
MLRTIARKMPLARQIVRQLEFWRRTDRALTRLGALALGWRYDCFVSPRARVFYAGRIRLAPDVRIEEGAILNYRSGRGVEPNLFIGQGTKVMPGATLLPLGGTIRIGRNCTINYGCLLYGVGGLEVGENTRIAAHTVMTPMNHVFTDPETPIWKQGETALGIRIGRDVWIGNGVKILDGVTIGDGSVVGAGSVVTKSLPPFSVAVGVPARVISRRGEGRAS